MRNVILFGSTALLVACASNAATARTSLFAKGTGLYEGIPYLPCKDIIANKTDEFMLQSANDWMKGFMSGINFSVHEEGRPHRDLSDPKIDPPALKARLVAYCYENPNSLLIDAGWAFYKTLPELPFVAD